MASRILVATVIALVAIGTGTASAATYFHGGTPTGNVLAAGDTIRGVLQSGTAAKLVSSVGTVTCSSSSFDDTVGASGGASVTSTRTTWAFGGSTGSCTGSLGYGTVVGCQETSAVTVSTTTASTGTTTMKSTVTLRCSSATSSCDFTGTIDGTFTNPVGPAVNVLKYDQVALTSPSLTCPAVTLSVAYAPVTVTSGLYSGQLLWVNGTP